jgi:hypothetical protein
MGHTYGTLEVAAHAAAVEVHAPRTRRAVRCRGPVVAGLDTRKRIAFCPLTSSSRVGKRGVIVVFIYHHPPLYLGR